MITTTLDPISLNDVTDIDNAPFVIEGEGASTPKIYLALAREGDLDTDGVPRLGRLLLPEAWRMSLLQQPANGRGGRASGGPYLAAGCVSGCCRCRNGYGTSCVRTAGRSRRS